MSAVVAITDNDAFLAKNHLEIYFMGKTVRRYFKPYSV
jgi:hypothetical protein